MPELGEDGGGVGGTVRALRNRAAVRAFVAVGHPAELVEQRRLDDQIDRTDLRSARETVERGHLRRREPVGAMDASNAVSTSRPSGSRAGGAVSSIVVETRSGTSGVGPRR